MAKTESKRAREAREQATATALEESPAAEPQPFNPPPPPKRKAGPGRPPAGAPRPINRTTFQRMQEIEFADWGTRAYVHLYRLEPFTDRLRSGTVTHIMRYNEPIDENRVMKDHGSGRYRAMLNFKKPGAEKDSTLDTVEFDILNLDYPPNVPMGEWVDEPRNKKWAWAKKILEERENAKNAPPPAPAHNGTDVVETLRVFNEIQSSAEARAEAKAGNQPSVLEMITAVKAIMPQPAPQTENALLTTIVTLMTEQTKAAQQEARELRQEIREARNQTTQQGNNANGLGTLKEVVSTVKDLLPALKEVFPNAADRVDGIVSGGRSRMSGWQEFGLEALRALAPTVAPAVPFLMQRMFSPGAINPPGSPRGPVAGGPVANPGQLPPPGSPGGPVAGGPVAAPVPGSPGGAVAEHPLLPFLQTISPPLIRYVELYAAGSEDHSGEDFYDVLNEMYGPTFNGQDWHSAAKTAGVMQLMMLYQQSAYWPKLQPIEAKFAEFMTQFLNAGPVEIEATPTQEEF